MPRSSSLRYALPALISGLLSVVVVALSWSSYRQLTAVLTDAAEDRLAAVTQQLVRMLEPTVPATLRAVAEPATDATLRRALAQPTPEHRAAAQRALEQARAGAQDSASLALLDRRGEPLAAAGPLADVASAPVPAPTRPRAAAPRGAGTGVRIERLVRTDRGIVFRAVALVVAPSRDTVGSIVLARRVTGTGVAQIRALIGSDAALLIGNADGSLWTDLETPVAGPPEPLRLGELTVYTDARDDRRVGLARAIPGTPWVVWVELDHALVLAPARAHLLVAAQIAVVCIVLGALAAWLLSRRVTGPLVEVTAAARDLANGDYARRVSTTRRDEIGSLARSFNSMATQIESATRDLRSHAGDLEALVDELRESEQRYRRLVEVTPDAILVHRDCRVAFANPAAAALFSATAADELVGRSVLELVPEEDRAELEVRSRRIQHGRQRLPVAERRVRRLDAATRTVETTSTPYTIDGEPAALTLLRDVTERKQLEARYRQAQKMDAVGQLAGGVAHDFNNVLTVVLTYSEMLLAERPADDPARDDLREIANAARRAAALTRQLLAFSRQQVLQPQVLDPNAVVTDLERMLRRVFPANIRLATSLDADAGHIDADPSQIEQVLLNLAVNARDAMPDGGTLLLETGNVEIGEGDASLHAGAAPGRYVLLTISDTGCGMTPEQQARAFEPFFTTKEPGRGTGLGLATVYGIVRQSGGHVWLYSQPGQGTVFKLYLPRVDEPVDARVEEPEADPEARGTETILLAEDEAPVRAATRRVLERAGYTVREAASGADALAICDEPDVVIDLLLTDMMMPEMSGPVLAERIHDRCPDARVVFMSGYTENPILRPSGLAPGVVFVQKPFTPRTLTRKVREALDARRR